MQGPASAYAGRRSRPELFRALRCRFAASRLRSLLAALVWQPYGLWGRSCLAALPAVGPLSRDSPPGCGPPTRFVGFAAYRKGRYAWTETALTPGIVPSFPPGASGKAISDRSRLILQGRRFCGATPAVGTCPPVAVWRQVPKRVPAILYCAWEGGIPMHGRGHGRGSRR